MEEAIKREVARQAILVKKELTDFVNFVLEDMRKQPQAAAPKAEEKEENPLGGLFARTHTNRKDLIYLTSMCTIIKERGVQFPRGAVQKAARDLGLKMKIAPNNSGRTAGYEMITKADAEKLFRYMQKNYKNQKYN